MKLSALLWAGITGYYIVLGLIYLAVSGDAAGTALLLLGAGFGGLVAGWLWRWTEVHAVSAADRLSADMADESGTLVTVSSASLRPLGIGVGMSAMILGVVLGSWMVLGGLAITASQVALLVWDTDR
ncbi:MAG: cytochrome c oxidase subunit 4 [Acidimicrobiales bacterium]